MKITRVLAEVELLEGAFQEVFGLDLVEVLQTKTWRWFHSRLQYLLLHDNPLSQHFAPSPEPPDDEEDDPTSDE